VETTSGIQALVYLLMLGVLLGLYKGDKGWGRGVLWVSLVGLGVLLVIYRGELFSDFIQMLLPRRGLQ
jgi:hypothetical protein